MPISFYKSSQLRSCLSPTPFPSKFYTMVFLMAMEKAKGESVLLSTLMKDFGATQFKTEEIVRNAMYNGMFEGMISHNKEGDHVRGEVLYDRGWVESDIEGIVQGLEGIRERINEARKVLDSSETEGVASN